MSRRLIAVGGLVLLAGCGAEVFLGSLPGGSCHGDCGESPAADGGGDAGAASVDSGVDGGALDGGLAQGPRLAVTPPAIAFGKVAYFASANPPLHQARTLTLTNTSRALDAVLELGRGGVRPYATVRALSGATSASELEVLGPPTTGAGAYPPDLGLEPGTSTALTLRLVPMSAGTKSFEVTVLSNDPEAPEQKVLVSAEAVLLPPCQYRVAPRPLDFGLLTPPGDKQLEVEITNLGQNPGEECILSGLELAAGSDGAFSLPGGAIAARELAPRESLRIVVRASAHGPAPAAITPALGVLSLQLSSPVAAAVRVDLRALIGPACLVLAPDERDFGTVKVGCSSASRSFSVYNVCSGAMTLTGIEVQAGSGLAPGQPGCPGLLGCPELWLQGTLPGDGGVTLEPGAAPLGFGVRYQPLDLGTDRGAIAVIADQGGQPVRYLALVFGAGSSSAQNTDTFVQDAKPKADLLLVIDDSGSMQDKRQGVADNFAAFMAYATRAGVDYHLAATTTDNGPGGEQGRFLTGPGHPEAVLSPATADVEAKFRAKVTVGTAGNPAEMVFEPALKALSAPLATGTNAGFLRDEASLAILAVTDEPDQSPQPVSYYLDALANVKGATRPNQFSFNAVAGFFASPPTGCTSEVDDGRLASAVTATGGVQESICTADWAKSLEQLGRTAFGYRSRFALRSTPDLSAGELSIEVDGAPVAQLDHGQTVWTYDPVANAVQFGEAFVPGPGQVLEVRYAVPCF